LKYDVKESLPATATLAFIVDGLKREGWTPMLDSDLPRYENSSLVHGWHDPAPESLDAGLHIWSARWRDADGNEVVYSLTYVCPLEQHGLHASYVGVAAWYYSREEARRARLQTDQEMERVSQRLKQLAPKATSEPCPR
jgi:hypothetical protein